MPLFAGSLHDAGFFQVRLQSAGLIVHSRYLFSIVSICVCACALGVFVVWSCVLVLVECVGGVYLV